MRTSAYVEIKNSDFNETIRNGILFLFVLVWQADTRAHKYIKNKIKKETFKTINFTLRSNKHNVF